jgi:hypothetical protein
VERGDITVEQLAILVLIASEGNWASSTTVPSKDGTRYSVATGEAVLGRRKFAKRYGLGAGGRDRVTRALQRGDVLGILSFTPAIPAPDPDAGPTPPGAPLRAPPPTLVKFKEDAEILFPALAPAPPPTPSPAPSPAPGGAPIQEGNQATTDTTSCPPAARRTRAPAGGRKIPDPRHRPLRDRLEAVFLEVRGVGYAFTPGKDDKAVTDLLRLSGGDTAAVEARWRRGLALGHRYPGCGSLAALVSRWNELALAGTASLTGTMSRNAAQPPSTNFTTNFEEVA